MNEIAQSEEIIITDKEKKFRETVFDGDYSKILNVDILCTACGININWMLLLKNKIMVHPFLNVLLCEGCLISVTSSNSISCCLWCGTKPRTLDLHHCSKCSKIFCSSCIRLNFGIAYYSSTQFWNKSWQCFLCNISHELLGNEFWMLRAICDGAKKICHELEKSSEGDSHLGDIVECVICTNDLDNVTELRCKHKFHKNCIETWINKNRSCPICRSPYVE